MNNVHFWAMFINIVESCHWMITVTWNFLCIIAASAPYSDFDRFASIRNVLIEIQDLNISLLLIVML